MKRIRKGDEVVLIAGKDKNRRGKVEKVLKEDRVVVSGLNLVKRHTRANPMRGVQGGIMEKEAPIHVSNVMIFNPTTQKGDRVGFRFLEDGRKVRYFKSTDEVIETP